MARKVCCFTKCHGPSRWKPYGIATKEAVTYTKLLGEKRGFRQFIEFNDIQISKSGKMDSYCAVDKLYTPSKGSNIGIFIFGEEQDSALYLEYSVHKQCVIKNCNDLITFLNFNKNSTFYLHNSFIYIKSADGFKWTLCFSVLEFFIKNLNISVIGSQFYFPLFSKYLMMNELRLLLTLKNCRQSVNTNFTKTFSQACEISTLRLKRVLTSGGSHSLTTLQNPKNNASFPSEQSGRKMKNLTIDSCKFIQKLQLKRKSIDPYSEDDCIPKTKRFNIEKNVYYCKNYMWKIFNSFENGTILNYTSILETRRWVDDPEAMDVFPIDCKFQTDCKQYSNSSTLHQNQNRLNQDVSLALNTSEKSSPLQLLDKISEVKNITGFCFGKTEEKQSKYEYISDFCTLKEMKSASDNRENSTCDGINNFPLAIECKNKEIYPKATITDKSQENIASSPREMPSKAGFVGINKHPVTFQTASGKSLKISEAALQAAEKMFEDISSENVNIFPQKKTQNAVQLKSVVNDKHCVKFQTAPGKSLDTSKVAAAAAQKMLQEITAEERDVFPEKQTQTNQNNKECYPSVKECVEEDISKVLAENFFEDIPFDEKEIDSKPNDVSVALSVQKPEITRTTHTYKIRKSLGGRRSLKPYTLKK